MDKGGLKNVATVDGVTTNPEVPVPTETKDPKISLTKKVTNAHNDGTGFSVPERAEFEITVTNTGNTTQTDVTVAEMPGAEIVAGTGYDIVDGRAVIASMAPGQTVTVKAAYAIKQADIDNQGATSTATVTTDAGSTDTATATIPVAAKAPGLSVVKTVSNKGTSGIVPDSFKVGDPVQFSIAVTNTGNATLLGVVVEDALAGASLTQGTNYTINELGQAVIPTLAPGETVTVNATYTVKQSDIDSGKLENIATATAGELEALGRVSVTIEPQKPVLTAKKSIANAGYVEGETKFKDGDEVAFDIKVKNDGTVTQTNVVVTEGLEDATISAPAEGDGYTVNENGQAVIASMAPGDEVTVKATYTVTQADVDKGGLKNVATVDGAGTDPEPEVEIPTPDKVEKLTAKKSIANAGYVEGETKFKDGDEVAFDIKVKNDGTVTQTNVVVTEGLEDATISAPAEGDGYTVNENGQAVIASMAPGDEVTVKATYTVTQADVDKGGLKNVATVDGAGTDPEPEVEIPTKFSFEVSQPESLVYDGQPHYQEVNVTDKTTGATLTENVHYTLEYSENVTDAGEKTVTITGIGDYTGVIDRTYQI